MTPLDDMDAFELQLRIERAQKRKRTARIMAALATTVLLISASTFYFTGTYQGMPLDPRPCEAAEVEALARDGWALETVAVEGAQLSGLVRPPSDPDAVWVLYFGGNVDHTLRTARAYLERLLGRDLRYGAASFAYRGFDTSTGITKPDRLQSDARAVFDHLVTKHGVRAERLHVVGFSLGASAAALLGQELAGTPHRLASTSLLSPGLAPHRLPPWLFPLVAGAWEMPSKLKTMRGPVLLVSATDDPAYPAEVHARKMPPLLGERLVKHLEVSGGHDGPLSDDGSVAAIRDLIGVTPPPEPAFVPTKGRRKP